MARGRPRKTDPGDVLETAAKVFWERGFDGTSMNELSAITGMAKPGLYATFGDKEALYAKALEHYFSSLGRPMLDDLENSPDPIDVVLRRFLTHVAEAALDKAGPSGCFIVNSMVECASKHDPLERIGRDISRVRLAAFDRRFALARKRGELLADADTTSLATFYVAQALALALMARAGADMATLDRLIDVAMTALPTKDA